MKKYSSNDYYGLLGLTFEATKEEIKKAFRRATVKYHPDVNKDGEKIFMQIKEAYEVLIDENERKNYDFVMGFDMKRRQKQAEKEFQRKKEEAQRQKYQGYKYDYGQEYRNTKINSEAQMAGKNRNSYRSEKKFDNSEQEKHTEKNFSDTMKDIIGNLFHGKNSSSPAKDEIQPKDGEDITMPLEITYKEALNGTNRKINVLHTEVCPICEGKRFTNGSKCHYCKGTGEVSLHKKLNVKIPPHTENNKKIRLKNEGTKGLKGGKNGNLYLVVRITDDSYFKFDGNNVFCEVEINPYEAVLGVQKSVKTLSGLATLKIPQGTSSGQKFRLAKEGLFDENSKTKGDQIVTVKIKVDENLTEREKRLYEELRNISAEK
mgnify:CR=1 FL=1